MKTLKNLGLLVVAAITLVGCTPNDGELTSPVPQNVAPLNGKSFSALEAQRPITFRWTPVVPKPTENVRYRLRVWQLMQGQNGTQAMRNNQPIITKETTNTATIVYNLYTGPCKPPYLCDFIWSVQVIGPNGSATGTTEITSHPTVFNF
jgi:hypothetical protein